MPRTPKAPTRRPCLICRKQCAPYDRNIDGTYAHSDCLRAKSQRMTK